MPLQVFEPFTLASPTSPGVPKEYGRKHPLGVEGFASNLSS